MTNAVPFDAFTLAAVAAELRATCVGARVQKVQQPSATELIVSLYGRTGAQRLLLCADPQRFRVHLTQVRRENPVNPPGFCQVCRKYLEGATLADIEMPRFDRLLHLVFRTYDGERAVLMAELMGRNANLVLVTGASETVRGILRPPPADSVRPLRPGQPYADPPGLQDRVDPLTVLSPADPVFRDLESDATPDASRDWLATAFSGIGRFGASEIVARAADAGIGSALTDLMDDVRTESFTPYSVSGLDGATIGVWPFTPLTVPPDHRFPRESISVALDTFYSALSERVTESDERDELARTFAREIAYRERELASARATLDEAGRAETYERMGNNLLAQLALVPRGVSEATIADLYSETPGATQTLTLDPKRSPRENADSLFDRARKARDAAEYAEGRLVDLQADLSRLRALERNLSIDTADRGALRAELSEIIGAERAAAKPATSSKPPPKEKPFSGHRIRTYTVEGYELLVGETAEANDYLTTRVASPSDLWIHVRAASGAHGILRTQGRPDRTPETVIRRAAEIVAARSGTSVKHASLVAVDITEKRHVRKPRGAKPGLVTYGRERVLDVEPSL